MLDNIIVPEGNIKVNANELKRAMEIAEKLMGKSEITQTETDYMKYFERKYVELPAIRLREQDMYNYLKRARVIADPEKDAMAVKSMENNYLELRDSRIKLQAELEKEKDGNSPIIKNKYINGRNRA